MFYKPLLRWAGGKRWLAAKIHNLVPDKYNDYYEPFCGSCAVFFALYESLKGKKIFLSDTNKELINFYLILQKNPKKLCKLLKDFKNDEQTYYYLREKNTSNDIEKAAIFFYLNRTSFNGIYRVNLAGKYNVPYGFKNYNTLFDYNAILKTSELIQGVTFLCDSFEWITKSAVMGDFIFLDPPYTVSHNNNGFIKYNKRLFSLDDQYKLKNTIEFLSLEKTFYMLTNAYHETIHDIFSINSFCTEIDRYTQISGKIHGRKTTKEYIFTNF